MAAGVGGTRQGGEEQLLFPQLFQACALPVMILGPREEF